MNVSWKRGGHLWVILGCGEGHTTVGLFQNQGDNIALKVLEHEILTHYIWQHETLTLFGICNSGGLF